MVAFKQMRFAVLSLALCAALAAAGQVQTFTGRITDTMCGAKHGMMRGQSDADCVRTCVRNSSSQYALYDGKSVLRLSDQKTSAKFAGQAVKITGTLNPKTDSIKVVSIEAAN